MIKQLANVAIIEEGEPYPMRIGVAFADGHTVTYIMDVTQPSPILEDMNRRISEMETKLERFVGYQYTGEAVD